MTMPPTSKEEGTAVNDAGGRNRALQPTPPCWGPGPPSYQVTKLPMVVSSPRSKTSALAWPKSLHTGFDVQPLSEAVRGRSKSFHPTGALTVESYPEPKRFLPGIETQMKSVIVDIDALEREQEELLRDAFPSSGADDATTGFNLGGDDADDGIPDWVRGLPKENAPQVATQHITTDMSDLL